MSEIKLKPDCELERVLNAYTSAVEQTVDDEGFSVDDPATHQIALDNYRKARAHLLEVIRDEHMKVQDRVWMHLIEQIGPDIELAAMLSALPWPNAPKRLQMANEIMGVVGDE